MQLSAPETVQAGTIQAGTAQSETVYAETSPTDTQAEGAESFEREGGEMIHLLPTITMPIHGASSMGNKP